MDNKRLESMSSMGRGLAVSMCFLVLSACTDESADNATVMKGSNTGAIERSVATRYRVNRADGKGADCYQEPSVQSVITVSLANNAEVSLVSVRSGMIRNAGVYWLHIHPEKYPNINCYIATNNLVPVPEY